MSTVELRGYVAALHEAGYAKTTIARRLASLRSFFRFGQREGWTKIEPGQAAAQPAQGRVAAALSFGRRHRRLLAAPPADEPLGLRDRAILETLTRPACA